MMAAVPESGLVYPLLGRGHDSLQVAYYLVVAMLLFAADVCIAAHRLLFQYMKALIMMLLRRTSRIAYRGESKMRKRVSLYPSSRP